MKPQRQAACSILLQDTGGQGLYMAPLCSSQSNRILPNNCTWEVIPNPVGQMLDPNTGKGVVENL